MSILYKLNEAEEARRNKYSQALRKSPAENEAVQKVEFRPTPASKIQVQASKAQAWMIKGIFVLLVVLILVVSAAIIIFLRNSSSAKRDFRPVTKYIEPITPQTKFKASATTNSPALKYQTKTSGR